MALFCSSVLVSHGSVTVSQHAQYKAKQLNGIQPSLIKIFSYCDVSKGLLWKRPTGGHPGDVAVACVPHFLHFPLNEKQNCSFFASWFSGEVNRSLVGGFRNRIHCWCTHERLNTRRKKKNAWSWPQSKPMRLWHAWQELNVSVRGHCVALA